MNLEKSLYIEVRTREALLRIARVLFGETDGMLLPRENDIKQMMLK
jgi:hypothetical protein